MLSKLDGYKTYIVAGVMILVAIAEKGLGIDVPGVTLDNNWMLLILNALGLGALRSGIGGR